MSRKRSLYEICSEYNLLMLEDDPYYYMQFQNAGTSQAEQGHSKRREPSFLSIDKDGRVIR